MNVIPLPVTPELPIHALQMLLCPESRCAAGVEENDALVCGNNTPPHQIYETVEQQKRLRERYRRVREYLRARTGGACESMQVVDASGTPDEVADLVKEAFDRIVRHVNRTQNT